MTLVYLIIGTVFLALGVFSFIRAMRINVQKNDINELGKRK